MEETGADVFYIEADVTNEEDCKKIVTSTVEKYGRLDIVVNNAGTSSAHPFERVETELWQQDLDLKLFGAIHCSRYAHSVHAASWRRCDCERDSGGCQNAASLFICRLQ